MKTVCLSLLACFISLPLPFALADDTVDFSRQILPILSNKCFICHGPDAYDQDLVRLDSFEGASADLGGHFAIDVNNLKESELLLRVKSSDDPMPPEDFSKQLSKSEKELLSRWVMQGGKYSKHWAFVPPVKGVSDQSANGDPIPTAAAEIDRLVKKQLDQRGIKLAQAADRETLARRVSLVLTGLPPSREQLDRFLKNNKEDAYSYLVDELLASPRFGEHQARYWLDAVRYGDTHGLHLDNRRGIYPYRDWVVKAHNENLPLDDFITWQIAGDLLPEPTLEQTVATGFVRLNPSTAEGGAIPAEFQAKNSFDRTENFGTVFLGLSLNCARCHTHKYDPITQAEYYELLAFFNSTAESAMDGNKYIYGDHINAPKNQKAWAEWREIEMATDHLLKDAQRQLSDSIEKGDRHLQQAADKAAVASGPEQQNQALMKTDKRELLAKLADPAGPFKNLDAHVIAKIVFRSQANAEKNFTTTLVARELPKPRPTYLLERGEYTQPAGDPLKPDVIKVLGGMPKDAPANRLGLAQWLTSPEHPLTSRVMVNQIWQRVFGYGLVRTPEDFGLQGKQPTHPELLDWLAVELQTSGWDLKQLMRSMVMSETFRQDSAWRVGIDDPENILLARGPSFRLDAEVLRDIGLWASGLLDPAMGGEGVKPYQPAGMWSAMAHPGSNTRKYERDKGALLYRRSLYVYWKRTSPHPMMTLFDAPSRESSCIRRVPTNTSLQSLALMNETQRIEMARMLAQRLLLEYKSDSERLNSLFQLLTCRMPSEIERKVCVGLLESMRERFAKDKVSAEKLLGYGDAERKKELDLPDHAAWTQVTAIVLASDMAILLY